MPAITKLVFKISVRVLYFPLFYIRHIFFSTPLGIFIVHSDSLLHILYHIRSPAVLVFIVFLLEYSGLTLPYFQKTDSLLLYGLGDVSFLERYI